MRRSNNSSQTQTIFKNHNFCNFTVNFEERDRDGFFFTVMNCRFQIEISLHVFIFQMQNGVLRM